MFDAGLNIIRELTVLENNTEESKQELKDSEEAFTAFWLQFSASASVTEAVVRISAGAANHMKVAKVNSVNRAIDELKKNGYWLYALEADGEDIYGADLTGNIAIVVGGEDSGVRKLTREKCDFTLSIPLNGKVNSLNASVALGIAAYEAVRKRR